MTTENTPVPEATAPVTPATATTPQGQETGETVKNPTAVLAKNKQLLATNAELTSRITELEGQLQQALADTATAQSDATATKVKFADLWLDRLYEDSPYIRNKLAVPGDMIRSHFGSAFTVEAGCIRFTDGDQSKEITTQQEFDAALQTLVSQYPYRDSITKGSGASGGGATGNSGSGWVPAPKPPEAPAPQPQLGLR